MMTDDREHSYDPANAAADRSIGESNAFSQEPTSHIDRLGPLFVQCLFSGSKTLQIYELNNRAAQTMLSRLMHTLGELFQLEGCATVAVVTDLLLINDVRIIVDPQSMGPVLYLVEEMRKRRVEEIDFAPGTTLAEAGSFLKLFFLEPSEEDVFGEISRRLSDAGVTNIKLTECIERVKYLRDAKVERRAIREESNKVMSRTILFMDEVMRAVEQRRPIQLPKAHRLAQQMADIIRTDETILVGLASIKDYDEYTFAHSVNVSVLSMLLSDRMGLHKNDTAQIGVAALFHDVGKTHIPQSILNKPETLTPGEWKVMERHPLLGVIELSRVRSLRAIADPLFCSLQHHLLYNGEGYPQKPGAWALHPYIPVITIADIFDAMTTPRVYRKSTLTPDRALRFIVRNSSEMFDPLVAKVFIKAMGVYPVGTVVELETGDKAVVVRQNTHVRLMHRPGVVLLNSDGAHGDPVDLAEQLGDGATYRHTIVRTVHDRNFEARKASCFIMR